MLDRLGLPNFEGAADGNGKLEIFAVSWDWLIPVAGHQWVVLVDDMAVERFHVVFESRHPGFEMNLHFRAVEDGVAVDLDVRDDGIFRQLLVRDIERCYAVSLPLKRSVISENECIGSWMIVGEPN